ncbi:aminotransferase class IV [Magnetospirillum molischianum]|uniref:Probable branched-chain-amino-acid aminotransferase n=1 Tax=Magnetospirillum molischianum DSM 120 TaxID=1150626 RepID=H8FSS3_MAGML|nr:aminotransferase class IV [Magnetospirillum molischianum]CCG41411.1 Branched-chain amino acid aminotransferase [Magnetospirillum molischianum DSM 120]
MIVWLNGTLIAEPRLDPSDRGFTLGDGLFETIRIVKGHPRHLGQHLDRLVQGCRVLRMPLPYDADTIGQGIVDLLAALGLTEATLRLTLTRGPAPRGLLPPAQPTPTLLMSAAAAAPPAGPTRLIVATVTRRNEHSPLSRLKSLNYLDNILARQEAADRGADDALLLNGQGRVTDTTIATLFARIDGQVVTPPVAEGVLPGIGRSLVLAAGIGSEREIPLDDLRRAKAIVLVNSLGVRPVIALDGESVVSCEALVAALRTACEG